ncbi:Acylphosphatase [archaeon HR05]|nr:Acylphosphatase [archaeon HR05]
MLAYKLIVRGRVQRVGFRRYVLEHARALGLKGNVRNEDDDSVHIHAQADDEDVLKRFIELIKSAPSPAYVASVEIIPAEVEDLKSFKIVYGELGDELQEGFGAMQSVFDDYRQEFRSYVGEFRSYVGEFRSYVGEFREFASRTDTNFAELKQEIRAFSDRTDANFAELKQEVRGVRDDLKQEIRAFSDRTDLNFKAIEAKYGEISEKLTLILNELKRSNEETRADLTRAMNILADILNRLIRLEEQREQRQ